MGIDCLGNPSGMCNYRF